MKEPGDRASGAHILPAVVGQRSTAPGVRPDQSLIEILVPFTDSDRFPEPMG
jgi:hypothetical protein